MYKCSPVEMRKNLQVVEMFEKEGIDFVAIPSTSDQNKEELVAQLKTALAALEG